MENLLSRLVQVRFATTSVDGAEDIYPVRVFGKLAETCEKVKKGAKVLVEGKLDISEYTDQQGQKRMTFRVLADNYRLLSKTKKTKGKS